MIDPSLKKLSFIISAKQIGCLIVILVSFPWAYLNASTTDSIDSPKKEIFISGDKDRVFDTTIDYLQNIDFFLLSVDKSSGFIQARSYKKGDKKMFSSKVGERRTVNFVLRQLGGQTKITLSIYLEEHYFGGEISPRTYYYKDCGIVEDAGAYRELLEGIKSSFD